MMIKKEKRKKKSGKNPCIFPARTLLSHQIHLLLVAVVDLELRQGAGVFSD